MVCYGKKIIICVYSIHKVYSPSAWTAVYTTALLSQSKYWYANKHAHPYSKLLNELSLISETQKQQLLHNLHIVCWESTVQTGRLTESTQHKVSSMLHKAELQWPPFFCLLAKPEQNSLLLLILKLKDCQIVMQSILVMKTYRPAALDAGLFWNKQCDK